jgi:ATP-binding cassette subfamily B protein
MARELTELSWPAGRLGEALETLGRHSRLEMRDVPPPVPPAGLAAEQLGPWIEATARWLGFEAESVQLSYGEFEQFLNGAAPALVRVPGPANAGYLVLLGGNRHRAELLTPTFARVRLAPRVLAAALRKAVDHPLTDGVEHLLRVAGLDGPRFRQALLGELLVTSPVAPAWILRASASAPLASLAQEARLPRQFLGLLGSHFAAYSLWILSWWLLGWMALQGRLETGWLFAWLLLLLTLLPCRLLATAGGGQLAIRAGVLLKRRLLSGALKLNADEVRSLGVGQLLGRVIESEAVESLAMNGGFLGLTALFELILAAIILAVGAGSWVHVGLLFGWVAAAGLLGLRYGCRRRAWTAERLHLTHDLVEQLLGHRTRLAQQPRQRWNDREDQALAGYLADSGNLDGGALALHGLVARGWLFTGLLGLAPAFLAPGRRAAALAIAIGGLLLAYRALRSLAESLEGLAGAACAWEQVQLFWRAAQRREPIGHPGFAVASEAVAADGSSGGHPATLLEARDLAFRYPDRREPILKKVRLQVRTGDRLLLEGPSGSGKSTLTAVLAGSRSPESGLLLLDGLDAQTLGAEGWRRRVVLAPQYHENHVLLGTFAFNVLLGRGWPPRLADLAEAEQVCRALGLGPLLDRMPAGMHQMVGETGWQLSHGERSRLYIARALLMRADLLILDESFAALDPQTLQATSSFVLEKAPTVLVIAHP